MKEDQKKPPSDGGGKPTVNFHGDKRGNQTHEPMTDSDARRARKSSRNEAKLSNTGNLLTESRNGLIVDAELLQANGMAERDAALVMLERVGTPGRITAGADKSYNRRDFVAKCRG